MLFRLKFPLGVMLLCLTAQSSRVECASDPKFPIQDLKAFRFLGGARAENDSLSKDFPLDRAIRDQLAGELAAIGLRQDQTDADFLVAFYAKSLMRSSWASLGYTSWDTSANVMGEPYQKGTVIVDFVSVRTNQLVWRGVAEGLLESKDRKKAVPDACRKLVQAFQKVAQKQTKANKEKS
ncbi:MAG: DUF4136 domain-containing protein [Acidobacteriia bacterium]|nr:DUF4136 domain-containing protein [Terriglobia bacterium]